MFCLFSATEICKPSPLLRAFCDLYCGDKCTFKFHMQMHFGDQLETVTKMIDEENGHLPDCTVLERKHKVFRYSANNMKVLKHFDKSVLRNLTMEHLHSLKTYE